MTREHEHDDDEGDPYNPYNVPTVGTTSLVSPCGCKVGLLSDSEPIPRRKAMHAGSLVNPWIVIHCEKHAKGGT